MTSETRLEITPEITPGIAIAPGIAPASASEAPLVAKPELRAEFRISPLIRLTLLLLYGALTLPLPVLAAVTGAFSPVVLALGLGLGAIALYAALTERVVVTETHIQLTYATWAKRLWRRSWSLAWEEISSLKPRSTGQGGIVYYFLSQSSDQAFLLPMRIAGFARLVALVEAKTGLDMRDVKPLAQPWMYLILLGCTGLLLLVDAWVLWMGLTQGFPV